VLLLRCSLVEDHADVNVRICAEDANDQERLTSNLLNAIWGTSEPQPLEGPTLREGIERRLQVFVQRRAEEMARSSPRSTSRLRLEDDVAAYIEALMAQCTEEQRLAFSAQEKRRREQLLAARRTARKEFNRRHYDDSNGSGQDDEGVPDRSDSSFSFNTDHVSVEELEVLWLKYKRRQKVRIVAAISQVRCSR
jgi:hypothetical protein